jgi:hypothetical protein
VATDAAVHLYAVTFDGNTINGAVHVRETGFTVPTHDVIINKIVGTSDGRIFLAGRDGCVHEVQYDHLGSGTGKGGLVDAAYAVTGWVSETIGMALPTVKRARCINQEAPSALYSVLRAITSAFSATPYEITDMVVDHDRRLLYTLSADAGIRVSMQPACLFVLPTSICRSTIAAVSHGRQPM